MKNRSSYLRGLVVILAAALLSLEVFNLTAFPEMARHMQTNWFLFFTAGFAGAASWLYLYDFHRRRRIALPLAGALAVAAVVVVFAAFTENGLPVSGF